MQRALLSLRLKQKLLPAAAGSSVLGAHISSRCSHASSCAASSQTRKSTPVAVVAAATCRAHGAAGASLRRGCCSAAPASSLHSHITPRNTCPVMLPHSPPPPACPALTWTPTAAGCLLLFAPAGEGADASHPRLRRPITGGLCSTCSQWHDGAPAACGLAAGGGFRVHMSAVIA